MGRLAAIIADRILAGSNARDLPVEVLGGPTLTINLKTARTIGVTVPPSLLARRHPRRMSFETTGPSW
jgi:putative ABC transport system substrate-binding protein